METLVLAQHRSKSQCHVVFGCSSPPRHFRGFNFRNFETGHGILPTPLKPKQLPSSPSPSSKTTLLATPKSNPRNKTRRKTTPKSAPVAINVKACRKDQRTFSGNVSDRSLLLSELWAGPTYSNSPPPSSLPIPKFSVKPKRTVSLDLPGPYPEIEVLHPIAKSAPSSPRREDSPYAGDFLVNADSVTKTLRRILNLNLDDDE